MVRVAVILVTLVAQVVSTFAQGAFVLCVRNDGQTKIEFAWSTCACNSDSHSQCHCGAESSQQRAQEDGEGCREDACGPDCACSHHETPIAAPDTRATPGVAALKGKCCTDYPLVVAVVSVMSEERNRPVAADRADHPCFADGIGSSFFGCTPPDHHAALRWCGPPGAAPPQHTRTTVLRC